MQQQTHHADLIQSHYINNAKSPPPRSPSPGTAGIMSNPNNKSVIAPGRRNSSTYSSMLAASLLNRASNNGGYGGSMAIVPAKAKSVEGDSRAETAAPSGQKAGSFSTGAEDDVPKAAVKSKIDNLLAPPAADAASLRRQVAALQADLEMHLETERRLQNVNEQLRERLELYMQQNQENVERAESELNTLHENMEQTLSLQRRLAQRTSSLEKEKKDLEQALEKSVQEFEAERSSLQTYIAKLSDDLRNHTESEAQESAIQAVLDAALAEKDKLQHELNKSYSLTDTLRQKAEKYSNELQKIVSKKAKDEMVEQNRIKHVMRRFLHYFEEAVKRQRVLNRHEQSAIEFAKSNCSRRGLHAFALATKRAIKVRTAYEQHARGCLQETYRSWHLITVASKRNARAVAYRSQVFLHDIILRWKSIIVNERTNKERERHLVDISTMHWRTSMKRHCLKFWKWWVKARSRPKKAKTELLQKRLDKLTCRQAFSAWLSMVREKQIRKLQKEAAIAHARKWYQSSGFNRWHNFTLSKRKKLLVGEECVRLWQIRRLRLVMVSWKEVMDIKSQKKIRKAFCLMHYFHFLLSRVFLAWQQSMKQQQAEAMAVKKINQALKRTAMLLWHDYHIMHAIKRKKELKAIINKSRREQRFARSLLIFWWEVMAWRRHMSQVLQMFLVRRQRSVAVYALHSWLHATFDALLAANSKFQNDLVEAKVRCEEQEQKTTAVDVENLQLIDRLHIMSSEIATLKITIAEKEKQEEDLRRALEDGAAVEGSLQGDIEQQQIHIEELELDILNLQKKLQMKNAEDTAGEVRHTLEIQNLEKTLKEMHIQLLEKTSQLESYEKALKDIAEQLEGASDESQEKLTSAFEIAASFRKLLEVRENQCATLEGSCQRKELELGEVQKKLAAVNCNFSQTIEARDAHIHELESLLMQKQTEMQEYQQELQDLQAVLDAKESRVRRLEYEIKLKSERESQRMKGVTNNVTPWSSITRQQKAGADGQIDSNEMVIYPEVKTCEDGVPMDFSKASLWSEQNNLTQSENLQEIFAKQEMAHASSIWLPEKHEFSCIPEEADILRVPLNDTETEMHLECESGSNEKSFIQQEGDALVTVPRSSSQASSTKSCHELSSVTCLGKTVDDKCIQLLHSRSLSSTDSLHAEIQQLQARIITRLRDPTRPEDKSGMSTTILNSNSDNMAQSHNSFDCTMQLGTRLSK